MSIGIIELNDAGLRYAPAQGETIESPGFALIDGRNLLLGQAAMQQARLQPLNTNNQFWHRLSAEPLPLSNDRYRHHADLAFSQLLSLHEAQPTADRIIFAVPGSFTRDQLSLLLGIAGQCPFQAVGLVDSAVAAAAISAHNHQAIFVDLQLHQVVLTRLNIGEQVQRQQVDVLPRAGVLALRDRWAKFIADQFVDQARFDPLHSAVTEQTLYDRLDQWLELARRESDLFLEVGGKTAKVSREQFIAPARELYRQILDKARQLAGNGAEVIFSDRFAHWPGLEEHLDAQARILSGHAVIEGVREQIDHLISDGGTLRFVQSLPSQHRPQAESAPRNTAPVPMPTHLLAGSVAFPLRERIFIHATVAQPISAEANNAIAQVERSGNAIHLLPLTTAGLLVNDEIVHDNHQIKIGDRIGIAPQMEPLVLIQVMDGTSAQ